MASWRQIRQSDTRRNILATVAKTQETKKTRWKLRSEKLRRRNVGLADRTRNHKKWTCPRRNNCCKASRNQR